MKYAVRVETDSFAGRINLILMLVVFVFIGTAHVATQAFDRIERWVAIAADREELFVPAPSSFAEVAWTMLAFTVICMIGTTLSEMTKAARRKSGDEET